MGGPACRVQLDAKNPSRRGAQAALRRFAVNQKSRAVGGIIGDLRAVAPTFLADDEEHADAHLAVLPETIDRGDLRGQYAFGVARSATVQTIVLEIGRAHV